MGRHAAAARTLCSCDCNASCACSRCGGIRAGDAHIKRTRAPTCISRAQLRRSSKADARSTCAAAAASAAAFSTFERSRERCRQVRGPVGRWGATQACRHLLDFFAGLLLNNFNFGLLVGRGGGRRELRALSLDALQRAATGRGRAFCKCPMRLPKSFFDLLRASSLSSTTGGLDSCEIFSVVQMNSNKPASAGGRQICCIL